MSKLRSKIKKKGEAIIPGFHLKEDGVGSMTMRSSVEQPSGATSHISVEEMADMIHTASSRTLALSSNLKQAQF